MLLSDQIFFLSDQNGAPVGHMSFQGKKSICSPGLVLDLLGLVASFILVGKQILRELCRDGVGWDDEIPDELKPHRERWRAELSTLEKHRVARCHEPEGFHEVKSAELR